MKTKKTFFIIIALFFGLLFAFGLVSGIKQLYFVLFNKNEVSERKSPWKIALTDPYAEIEIGEEPKRGFIFNREANHQGEFETKPQFYTFDKAENFPKLSAKSYVVADLDSGQIIVSKDKEKIYPIASLSKLMTALVSLENQDQNGVATVSSSALNTYGRQGNFMLGQKIKISDLIYPLLLESSNDAAEILAEFSGRNIFLDLMNEKSKDIGLGLTNFSDPSGLSKDNVSTATNLLKLVRYIDKDYPEIFEMTKLKSYDGEKQRWYNISRFRNDKNYIGGKNGYTDEALQTLISMFELPLAENENKRIVIILLQGNQVEKDTRSTLLWLLKNVYYK